ncbi:beta-galactosidase [Luteolibacter arcticus]|uniref:Beta-galactosidase n=1 Tax=Luteolibacter arcticus TaxID=1581411 RepID=A0ABT3GRC1_9BACT|nr:beta-galactosidase family protein [Luteolibacter arcticus]MCW1926013.1 beta-galactosidase [Luteolibacter arcticus]
MKPFAFLTAAYTALLPISHAATFEVAGNQFHLDGQAFQIRAGEMHYPRIPRAEWANRVKMAKAMGLNTVSLYLFWNLHEERPGQFDFEGQKDFVAFIRECGSQGMKVIVRPGPYVCAEWELGGIPAWVMAEPGVKLRSTDRRYLEPAKAWMRNVAGMLEPLSVAKDGPVLMLQLENEFGSFASDPEYLRELEAALRGGGYTGLLFAGDGPGEETQRRGGLPGLLKAANFGKEAKPAFETLEKVQPGKPRFTAEFWIGWFDQWGRPHHRIDARQKSADLEWMMDEGVSFNLYMFHGGTTRGFWTGANWDGAYRPTTNSYDYSAPLDESGRPTPKYHIFREIISRRLGQETLPEVPALPSPGTIGPISLGEQLSFLKSLPAGETKEVPASMEQFGQGRGFVLYRAQIKGPVDAPLDLAQVQDRVIVLLDGKRIGLGGRSVGTTPVQITAGEGSHRLDLLVENMGRINFGPVMNSERKGLTGIVRLGDRELAAFEHISLPLDQPLAGDYEKAAGATEPGQLVLRRSKFKVATPQDTWLDLRGFGRGVVWLNGINLGRYWSIGPQQTIYVPSVWLRSGGEENELVVLELEKDDCPQEIPTLKEPVWSILPGK